MTRAGVYRLKMCNAAQPTTAKFAACRACRNSLLAPVLMCWCKCWADLAADPGGMFVCHHVDQQHRHVPKCHCGQHLFHLSAQAKRAVDAAVGAHTEHTLHRHLAAGMVSLLCYGFSLHLSIL